jgi:alkanesulfonate monooxygenase SsuD/methylene tetrahydromethanopterin reductase-like flavin-dependent oxidoreductase (luciferase family)
MHTHVDAQTTETRLADAIAILQAAGYDGYWGVEHHSAKNEYSEVEWQLAVVRRTLAKIRSGA